jgi:hypothetical protein
MDDQLVFDIGYALSRLPVRGVRPMPSEDARRQAAMAVGRASVAVRLELHTLRAATRHGAGIGRAQAEQVPVPCASVDIALDWRQAM